METLRNNWFVLVIAIVLLSFIVYFVYDGNKYNVSSLSKDGKDIVASSDAGTVSADDLYTSLSEDDDELLYNLYRNAVVAQSVETTDEIEEDAKTLEDNIESYAKQQDADNYETIIEQELAAYGYSSYDQLSEYCLMSVKQKEMNEAYVTENFDSLSSVLDDKKPRTISVISMGVLDPDNLTEDEQTKKDNIDSSLESQDFAKTATAYSEDSTASEKGMYGYIDTDNVNSSSESIPSEVIEAALELDKGETSDWITYTDSDSGLSYLYKVHVNQTDLSKIYKSKNETIRDQVLYAILNNTPGLEETIVQENANELKVKFNDETTEEKVTNYINAQKEEN